MASAATCVNVVPPSPTTSSTTTTKMDGLTTVAAAVGATRSMGASGRTDDAPASTVVRKNRSQAREQVATAWQERRKQQQQQRQPANNNSNNNAAATATAASTRAPSPTRPSQQQPPPPKQQPHQVAGFFPFPTLCSVIGRAWDQAMPKHRINQQQPNKRHEEKPLSPPVQDVESESASTTLTATPSSNTTHTPAHPHNRFLGQDLFPSMLPILQAKALASQIEYLQQEAATQQQQQPNSQNNVIATSAATTSTTTVNTPLGMDADTQQQLWAVLPSCYNWDQAVSQMAQSRSRAFWLVDLTTLVHQLVAWQRRWPHTRFLYRVSANADPVLLKLLGRFDHVGLVCQTAWDVERCQSLRPNDSNNENLPFTVLDDSTTTCKPDGYWRRAVRAGVSSLALAGPDDVHRLANSLRRWAQRQSNTTTSSLSTRQPPPVVVECCLRLSVDDNNHKNDDNTNAWYRLWKDTAAALAELLPQPFTGRLVALSLDVADGQGLAGSPTQSFLQALLQQLARDNDDNNSNGNNTTAAPSQSIRLELTGLSWKAVAETTTDSNRTTPPPQTSLWWWQQDWMKEFLGPANHHHKLPSHATPTSSSRIVSEIAIDCTQALLEPASALCTRVIGVKRVPQPNGEQRHHYYIDDGCYGSLYQTSSTPVPLVITRGLTPNSNGIKSTTAVPQEPQSAVAEQPAVATPDVFLSTVWGPTCDGLDRVCQNVKLPMLQRDDWLVFFNCSLGEGLGTAFNGFCPPDTAYCVLRYFHKK